MYEFEKYRRTNIAEMRNLGVNENQLVLRTGDVSVSCEDQKLHIGEFLKGKVARNPDNHNDQWYVANDYFEDNFEKI